jgi:hypothetical protein
MITRSPYVFVVGLCTQAALLAGCPGPGITDSEEGKPVEKTATAAPRPGLDGVFTEIGVDVPAFGGMFFEDDGQTLVVHVTELTPGIEAEIMASIQRVLGDDPRFQQAAIELRECEYTFLQLAAWHDELSPLAMAEEGVVFSDIDEQSNRLRFGVETADAQGRTEELMAGLDIPEEAVIFEITDPVVPAGG